MGDEVVFVKEKENKWVLMTVNELTNSMVDASREETITESREGFKKELKEV